MAKMTTDTARLEAKLSVHRHRSHMHDAQNEGQLVFKCAKEGLRFALVCCLNERRPPQILVSFRYPKNTASRNRE